MFLISSQLSLRKKRSAVIHFTSVAVPEIVVCSVDVVHSLDTYFLFISDFKVTFECVCVDLTVLYGHFCFALVI